MFINYLLSSLLLTSSPVTLDDEFIYGVNYKEIKQEGNLIRAGVSINKDLPQDFYGTWSVVSTLVETNNPELFKMRTSDLWSFQRAGDVITLSNPVSGANASITVNEVINNTASFSRSKTRDQRQHIEELTITVDGETFFGTDTLTFNYLKNGEVYRSDIVKYKLRGYKISGPTLKNIFSTD